MISKDRVRHMTKLAAFEEQEGKEELKIRQYFRSDYVGLEMLKSFVMGTIAFVIMLLMWGIYKIDYLLENINKIDLFGLGTEILIKYLIMMAVYLLITYVVYNIRYTRGRKQLKLFYGRLKKVSRLYESESRPGSLEEFD